MYRGSFQNHTSYSKRKPCNSNDPHEVSTDHSLHCFAQTAGYAMGLKLGCEWSLLGLGMGITTALCHDSKRQPDSQRGLYASRRTDKAESGTGVKRWQCNWSKPVAKPLALCNNCFNSVIEKGRLYFSSFLEKKSRRPFSFNNWTLWNLDEQLSVEE